MSKTKWLMIFAFLLVLVPLSYAADDQYKPYLHKPTIPEHPKAKLYGKYSTNLFPGAGTYTYPIEVPKGTNNLQPSLSISYNSQAVKQRPSFLGAGWALTQNYVYRDVNFTPSNTTDDEFKLILNGASYDLIFDSSDGFYHTEIETFARIQNISTTSNTYKTYWLITLKDGTQLRFGYNSDSELTSNVGYSYALKWSLDQIEDTHSNKIFYSYSENPYAQDNGSVYVSQIIYNNDQKRRIDFGYENSNRPDRRRVYEQGNVLEESRRLSDISILFNDTLVRRYNFEHISLNNESSLSSLYKIRYIGADNISVLHNVTFGYYESTSSYYNSTTYNISELFQGATDFEDLGVRLIDLNNDGFIDIIRGDNRGSPPERRAFVNNRTGWNLTTPFNPPEDFVYVSDLGQGPIYGLDRGLRIADLNNDGFADLIQGWGGVRKAWLNNITGWQEDSLTWAPSIDFVASNVDQGMQLVDFNGDGKVDLLQAKDGSAKNAYLNTGNGWKEVSSLWSAPTYFVQTDGSDYGTRLVDVNGDGLIDILEAYNRGTETKNAWLNNGSGWVSSSAWIPPDVFTSNSRKDNGMRLIDLNGDGLVDILQDYKNQSAAEREAFINNGNGWSNTSSWSSPEPFTKDGKNIGRRIGDANGDGFGDIIIGHNDGVERKYTAIRNSTFPYLLKNITNEFGGLTYLNYEKSTIFNNTGNDSASDIGFNVWVVEEVIQNNSLTLDFNVLSNTSYYYFGGKYDYDDAEFRGFNVVNETLNDKSIISHYFHQNKQLKGKEFKTEAFDSGNNIYSAIENQFNFTTRNNGIYLTNLLSTSTYIYDGNPTNPKITNISYKYDNHSNIIEKIQHGDISIAGDEKNETYSYAVNISSWILDKPAWYILFDSSHNKIRETKYFYDNHQYGDPPSKGDLTKTEQWLNDETGNPTTSYVYDDYGNLYRQTDALGRTTTRDYGIRDDTNTYPDRITNALGHAIDYTYDVGTGNVLNYIKHGVLFDYEYDTFGRITKDIDPYDTSDFPTKKYTYDFDGIAPEIIKVSQRTTSNNTIDIYYFYDGFANLVQIKTPSDNGQQVVKNLFYDGFFRVKEEQNPYFDSFLATSSNVSNTTNRTKYNYDALGRVTSVTNPDGTTKNTTYNKSIIDDYDANRNRHTYILDAYDRIIEVKEYNTDFYIGDNETYNTTYSYNGADELIGIRDTLGNTFNFSYDSLGRKTKLDDPDLGVWTYHYDLTDNLIKQIDNKQNQILLSYDDLNRIKQKNTTSIKYNFTYDIQYQGTLSKIKFENITYSYTYDGRLRAIKEKRTSTKNEWNISMEKEFTYDSMNRIRQIMEPNGRDIDIYYSHQNKINKIKGWINQSSFNAVSNPLNRTYNILKTAQFDYYPDNLRLKQIKTDTTQILNYSYDNVGNIVGINDQVNNRLYSMSYDRLDRLTNVTIGAYKWVYSYNAIGNVLKIVRNHSTTTSFKFDGSLAHAPQKYIVTNASVDVYRQTQYNKSNRTQVFEFTLVNEKNVSLNNVSWTAEFGDGLSTSSQPLSIGLNSYSIVSVEHNYSKGGNYLVNLTGKSNDTLSDYEPIRLLFGTTVNDFSVLLKNASTIILELDAKNSISDISTSWAWNCSNIINSSVPFNMSSNENLMLIIEHNFTLKDDGYNITCRLNSSDGNQSKKLSFNFDGLKIENYNSTKIDIDTILVKFQIKNYYLSLSNINWNITADNLIYNASGIALNQGQTTAIVQEINFTNAGLKQIKISVGNGNFTDTYSENVRLYAIGINQFINYVKNGTTRIFNFLIKNDWTNLSAYWNISNPGLDHTLNLSQNESLIVVIEENYGQGQKDVSVNAFNNSFLEDIELDVFKIKHIGINRFEVLFENTSKAVTNAFVVNNINKLNLSWRLDNSQQIINSTQNLELNTSEQAFVIVESNFSTSGIYPLNFLINSSLFNDNQTGVAVS